MLLATVFVLLFPFYINEEKFDALYTFRRGSSDNTNSREVLDVQDTTQSGYFCHVNLAVSHVIYSRTLVQNKLSFRKRLWFVLKISLVLLFTFN